MQSLPHVLHQISMFLWVPHFSIPLLHSRVSALCDGLTPDSAFCLLPSLRPLPAYNSFALPNCTRLDPAASWIRWFMLSLTPPVKSLRTLASRFCVYIHASLFGSSCTISDRVKELHVPKSCDSQQTNSYFVSFHTHYCSVMVYCSLCIYCASIHFLLAAT